MFAEEVLGDEKRLLDFCDDILQIRRMYKKVYF